MMFYLKTITIKGEMKMNIITTILKFFLDHIFSFTGDWGITIIVVTILVKTLLMPLSIKQKLSLQKQQSVSVKVDEIKEKYKDNKAKLDAELQKFYGENSKSMMGCLVSFLQLPVIFSLYRVISSMTFQTGTMLIPWIQNIKLPDSHFVIPLIYVVTALSPSIINLIPALRVDVKAKVSKTNIIITSFFSILITIKAPVALGIYLISSSLFSFIEEIIFRIYYKKKALIC